MPKHNSEDLKITAVEYYLDNHNQTETCDIFNCSRRSLMRWVDKYQNDNGRIQRYEDEAISYKVKKKHVKFILKQLKENNKITMNELLAKLNDKFNDIDITRQWLGRVIRDNNLTRKRLKTKHYAQTRYRIPYNVQTKLDEFYQTIDGWDIRNIISIDETSIKPDMAPSYARCKLGQRCYRKTTSQQVFKKYTLLVAISNSGVIGWKLYETGAVNGERFNQFLKDFITNRFRNKLIIMDNAAAHRTNIVKKTITDSGNQYLYAVAYRPQTNAIEEWFSQLKHYLKLDPALQFNQIKRSIERAITKIKPEHYRNYFRHAYRSDDFRDYQRQDSTLKRKVPKYKE